MEKLEEQIQKAETSYLSTVAGILNQTCCSRVKMALIYKAHVRCLVAIDDFVAEAKLATPPAGEAGSN
jgi:hypothetical protein